MSACNLNHIFKFEKNVVFHYANANINKEYSSLLKTTFNHFVKYTKRSKISLGFFEIGNSNHKLHDFYVQHTGYHNCKQKLVVPSMADSLTVAYLVLQLISSIYKIGFSKF